MSGKVVSTMLSVQFHTSLSDVQHTIRIVSVEIHTRLQAKGGDGCECIFVFIRIFFRHFNGFHFIIWQKLPMIQIYHLPIDSGKRMKVAILTRGVSHFRSLLVTFQGNGSLTHVVMNPSFEVESHHALVSISVVVEVVDQGVNGRQPCFREHRISSVAQTHIVKSLTHRLFISTRKKHRQRQDYS